MARGLSRVRNGAALLYRPLLAANDRSVQQGHVDVEMAPPRLSTMWMLLIFEFNWNGNKASVTHTALGDDMLSEVPDIAHRAPEHR
jgi:hypothetical protein